MTASLHLYETVSQLRRLRDPDGELHLQRHAADALLGYIEAIAEEVAAEEAAVAHDDVVAQASASRGPAQRSEDRDRNGGTVVDFAAARRIRRRLHGLPPTGGGAA